MEIKRWVQIEEQIKNFWESINIFKKVLEKNRSNKQFVFYEGPPYANAKPHMGHFLTRTLKDIVLRYKSLTGYYVPRFAGWDTHGLPIEVVTEKELGFKNKKDILNYGIERFNKKCKELVIKFKDVWEEADKRIGYWIDHTYAYITFDPFYMESVWWIVKKIFEKGFLKEEYGVVSYCTRCETVLSRAELGMPDAYVKVKDPSVYVKFKITQTNANYTQTYADRGDEYLLVWTTTPWTLPGNLALAVHPDFDYYLYETEKGNIWTHQNLDYKVLKQVKGKDLVGLKYEPLFKIENFEIKENHYQVYPATFIKEEEGTGIVHIAPAYGEEDFELGKKYNLGLVDYLDDGGKFKPGIFEPLNNELKEKWFKEGDKIIFAYLKEKGLIFEGSLDGYEHEYPHCWRCKYPLIYQARKSWVIKTSLIKNELLEENKKVNWVPKEIGEGRFANWLNEGKDWHVSRSRFWGIPIPIWRCSKCQKEKIIGSLEELAKHKKGNNEYYLMRHLEAFSNVKKFVSSYPELYFNPLTPRALKVLPKIIKKIKKFKIDFIISSPILRAKETAFHISDALNIPLEIDERLREVDLGIFNGKSEKEYDQFIGDQYSQYVVRPKNGENLTDVVKRMISVIIDLENRFKGKKILIISHGDPLWALAGEMQAKSPRQTAYNKNFYFNLGEIKKIKYLVVPRDENGLINLHRPYVDNFSWQCSCGGEMKRIEDVLDIWFDSGSVPFASYHYPFENKNEIDKGQFYPADFIGEGLDQTRGWFYTLLVIGYLIKNKAPYKNVLVNGFVMDEKGKKMSKSLGNVVDPLEIIEKYGADLPRFYLTRINDPWLNKNFSEKEMMVTWQNVFLILHNIFNFYQHYYHPQKQNIKQPIKNILDKWFESRIKEISSSYIDAMDKFNLTKGSRLVEEIIDEFSRWWIRRSRERFQSIYKVGPNTENLSALKLLENYFFDTILLLAPFAPFTAEYFYQKIKNEIKAKEISIHLHQLKKPEKLTADEKLLLKEMSLIRNIASTVNNIREKYNLRVRQPLPQLYLNIKIKNLELLNVLKEEINVKSIKIGEPANKEDFIEFNEPIRGWLDVKLTDDLIMEGLLNDLIRHLQNLRNLANLKPKDNVYFIVSGDKYLIKFIKDNKNLIARETRCQLKTQTIKGKVLVEKEVHLRKESGPVYVSLVKKE